MTRFEHGMQPHPFNCDDPPSGESGESAHQSRSCAIAKVSKICINKVSFFYFFVPELESRLGFDVVFIYV